MPGSLPEFVEPMLCGSGKPFDSDDHLFEVKWDGTRALSFTERSSWRLFNRRKRDCVVRYPELAFLADLEPGLVLDGEIVVMKDGKPSFRGMISREQARDERRAAELARALPAVYVPFDVLYRGGKSLMDEPLTERRRHLEELTRGFSHERLQCSEGVVGTGKSFFELVRAQELEGVVAKRLTSPYHPGKRTDAWLKIKEAVIAHCLILGYQLDDAGRDLRSLIVAMDDDGKLCCVGKVGSGLTEALRAELLELMRQRPADAPLVECDVEGEWVEPGLYCKVAYLERTESGNLRAPVFRELIRE